MLLSLTSTGIQAILITPFMSKSEKLYYFVDLVGTLLSGPC